MARSRDRVPEARGARWCAVGLVVVVGAIFWLPVGTGSLVGSMLQAGHLSAYLLALLAGERRPRAVFLGVTAIALSGTLWGITREPFVIPAWALYRATFRTGIRHRVVVPMMAPALCLVLVSGLPEPVDEGVLLRVMTVTTLLLGAWVLGSQGHAESTRRDRRARARELTGLLEERVRISRELHDVLSHTLGRIGVQAGVAAEVDDGAAERGRVLREIEAASGAALAEVRRLLASVRTEEAGGLGGTGGPGLAGPTVGDVEDLLRVSREAGIRVAASIDLPGGSAAPLGRHLYRIVQELITNIGRHAAGSRGRLEIRGDGDRLLVRAENDVLPLDPCSDPGLGLLGVRERVGLLDGSCDVVARPGSFAVEVSVPYPPVDRARGGETRDRCDAGR